MVSVSDHYHADAFGRALLDQLSSLDDCHSVYHVIERDDGYVEAVDTTIYFSPPKEWPDPELDLLGSVSSPILDVGCGAGRHSLYLQELGHEVYGLDVSPGAIETCQKRGLKRVILSSIFNLPQNLPKYQTFLLMGNNFGIGGSIDGCIRLLRTLHSLSTEKAVVIGSYINPLPTNNPFHAAYHGRNEMLGHPPGRVFIRIRYLGYATPYFSFLLPTSDEFHVIIENSGWKLKKDVVENSHHYFILEKTDV